MLTPYVDTTYADSGADPSVAIHQQDHDLIHRYLWLPPRRRPSKRPWGFNMVWGGQTGHSFTSAGAGATFNLNDTTDFVLGDRAMKVTTAGTNTQTYMQRLGGAAMDLTNRCPRIWVKVDNYTAGCDLRFWLGTGGAWANYFNWSWTDGDANRFYADGEWVQQTLPWSRASTTGSPTRNALTDIRLTCYDASTAMTVHFGGFGTQPDTTALWPNGVVSLTFDDGFTAHSTQAKMYMDKYGFTGTEYPIIDLIGTGGYMTLAQLKALHFDSGWEIGLHSSTAADHNGSGGFKALTTAQRVENIRYQKEYLATAGLPDASSFAYPQGEFDVATVTDLIPWVESARTTKSGQRGTFPPSDRMKLYTRALGNTDTAATATALIDSIKTNKEWQTFCFHNIVTTPTTSLQYSIANFQTVIDYLSTQGVAVRTVGEVLATTAGV